MTDKRIIFHDQIARNKRNSFFLMMSIVLIICLLGLVIGLTIGYDYFFFIMIFAIVFSLVYVLASYKNSDKIALASVNAKPADPVKHRMLIHSVESVALASGMPVPKTYVMPGAQINAFASGKDPKNSVICFTEGAIEKLDKQELEGVVAHEISHIANYDIRFMTLTVVLVGMVSIISQIFLRSLFFAGGRKKGDARLQILFIVIGIVLAILAPIATYFVQMAISRKREYSADASAVKFIRSPTGLKKALIKIKNDSVSEKPNFSKAVAPLFISDPFKTNMKGLSSTHPPIEKRIEILERM